MDTFLQWHCRQIGSEAEAKKVEGGQSLNDNYWTEINKKIKKKEKPVHKMVGIKRHMADKSNDSRRLLAKTDSISLIETLQKSLAKISLTSSKTAKELDEKVISLVEAIDIAMDAYIPKARLCPRSVPAFDKDCKDAQMRARRPKKIWKKEGTEETWEAFRLARGEKGRVIAKVKKKA